MRVLLTILLVLMVLPGHAAHIAFNLGDFTTIPLSIKQVKLSPQTMPSVTGGQIITRDTRIQQTATNGTTTFSNVVAGTYKVDLYGPTLVTTFEITVTNFSGTIDAKDIISVSTNSPYALNAYSMSSADSRFMRQATNQPGTAGQVLYSDGTIQPYWAAAPGGGGGGAGNIVSINGMTNGAQQFVFGTNGTAPNVATNLGTNTLHIPWAGLERHGLLTSNDWQMFNGKQAGSMVLSNYVVTGGVTNANANQFTLANSVLSIGSGSQQTNNVFYGTTAVMNDLVSEGTFTANGPATFSTNAHTLGTNRSDWVRIVRGAAASTLATMDATGLITPGKIPLTNDYFSDVSFLNLAENQVAAWDAVSRKWTNRVMAGGETNTASNLGTQSGTVQGLFSAKSGVDLMFRSIEAATGISLHSNATTLIISNTQSTVSGEANTASSTGSGVGIVNAKSGVDLPFKSFTATGPGAFSTNATDITLAITAQAGSMVLSNAVVTGFVTNANANQFTLSSGVLNIKSGSLQTNNSFHGSLTNLAATTNASTHDFAAIVQIFDEIQVKPGASLTVQGDSILTDVWAKSATVTNRVAVLGLANDPGILQLHDTNHTLRIGLAAPSVLASNFNLVMPSNAPPTDGFIINGTKSGTNTILNWAQPGQPANATLTNLASTGAITNLNANQFNVNNFVGVIKSNALTTNIIVYHSTGGPATNVAPSWVGVTIGGEPWPTLRHTSRYGEGLDLVTIRTDANAATSNILYYGNQEDGRIFAMDWKIGDKSWGNSSPRYVWNFLGNDEGAVYQQNGEYLWQIATNSFFRQAYGSLQGITGEFYIYTVTNTTLLLGPPAVYPVELRGTPLTIRASEARVAGLTNNSGSIRFFDTNRTLMVSVSAPVVLASNFNITLPSNAPPVDGYILKGTKSGTNTILDWVQDQTAAGGGDGTGIQFYTNTTAVGIQTNYNLIITNGGGLSFLATNNTGANRVDYHLFLANDLNDSIAIPMGAWRTNDLLGAHPSGAQLLSFTNVADGFSFTNVATNGIRSFFALPITWDAGGVRVGVRALCPGTNDPSATNVVWSVRAAAVKDGGDASDPTFGTAITMTNRISISANISRECISRDLTIGNSPASTNSILWEIQRLGSDAGDTMTNNANVRLIEVKVYYKHAINATWPAPSL